MKYVSLQYNYSISELEMGWSRPGLVIIAQGGGMSRPGLVMIGQNRGMSRPG